MFVKLSRRNLSDGTAGLGKAEDTSHALPSLGFPYTSPTPETAAKGAGRRLALLLEKKQLGWFRFDHFSKGGDKNVSKNKTETGGIGCIALVRNEYGRDDECLCCRKYTIWR